MQVSFACPNFFLQNFLEIPLPKYIIKTNCSISSFFQDLLEITPWLASGRNLIFQALSHYSQTSVVHKTQKILFAWSVNDQIVSEEKHPLPSSIFKILLSMMGSNFKTAEKGYGTPRIRYYRQRKSYKGSNINQNRQIN